MLFCPKCHTQLVENAKFCHQCGSAVEVALCSCGNCGKMNPADAPFCYGCAHPMRPLSVPPQYLEAKSKYPFADQTALEESVKAFFFEELKRLANLVAPQKIDEYLRAILSKDFSQTVQIRSAQLAEEFSTRFKQSRDTPSVSNQVLQFERMMEHAVTNLAIYLIVHNCQEVNPLYIPEKILRYENVHRGNVNLQAMIFDFLDFDNERERVYTNFVTMPTDALENAAKHFLHKTKDEYLYFISDQTLFGSSKEGFAMTEFGIYWKATTEKPQRIYYHHLARLERHKTWALINNRYFNVNQTLNVKMLLLLEKLKNIYAQT